MDDRAARADTDANDPRAEMPRPTYYFVCAGAVELGVVVTDIDTLP
jgi:hypothetical protein